MTNSSSLLDLTKAFKSPSPNKRIIHPTPPVSDRPSKRAVLHGSSSRQGVPAHETRAEAELTTTVATGSATWALGWILIPVHAMLGIPAFIVRLPMRLAHLSLSLVVSLALSFAFFLLDVSEGILTGLGVGHWSSLPQRCLDMARQGLELMRVQHP